MLRELSIEEDPLDLSDTDTTHAFDRPDFQEFILSQFPELEDRLSQAVRPRISQDPDELEKWETIRVQKRKDKMKEERDQISG